MINACLIGTSYKIFKICSIQSLMCQSNRILNSDLVRNNFCSKTDQNFIRIVYRFKNKITIREYH